MTADYGAGRLPGAPLCPACGTKVDAYTSAALDDATPHAGDFTVCAYCASLLVFGDDLHPRFPTDAELVESADIKPLQVARAAVLEMIRRHALPPNDGKGSP